MASKRLSMRKIREVLRLHHVASMSGRAIARSIDAYTGRGRFSRDTTTLLTH